VDAYFVVTCRYLLSASMQLPFRALERSDVRHEVSKLRAKDEGQHSDDGASPISNGKSCNALFLELIGVECHWKHLS
jgi:hypothetical protein